MPNGDLLICGGLNPSGSTSASILRLDLAQGTTAGAGRLAVPVHDAGGARLGDQALILGGGSRAAGSVVQRVDGTLGPGIVGHLPAARADLSAVAVDGEIVVVGGGTPAAPDSAVLATTDGAHFTTVGRLTVPVRYAAVAVVGGMIVVAGGSTPTGDSAAIQLVDPRTGSVRIIGHLPYPLSHAAALVIAGRLYLAGGDRAGIAQDAVWQIDATSGRVIRAGRLPMAESDAAAVVVGGTGYLIGGEGAAGSLRLVLSLALG